MPDTKTPRDDQRDPDEAETQGRNRHGTMDDGAKGGTKGSNFENSGPNDHVDSAGGAANPHLAADQSTTTKRK